MKTSTTTSPILSTTNTTAETANPKPREKQGQRHPQTRCKPLFILVTAHPDDESMFFLPTIRTMLLPSLSPPLSPLHDKRRTTTATTTGRRRSESTTTNFHPCHFHVLCLSNGNYHGLGAVRERELHNALETILSVAGAKRSPGTGCDCNNSSRSSSSRSINSSTNSNSSSSSRDDDDACNSCSSGGHADADADGGVTKQQEKRQRQRYGAGMETNKTQTKTNEWRKKMSDAAVMVVDHPKLQDGPNEYWDEKIVSSILCKTIKDIIARHIDDDDGNNTSDDDDDDKESRRGGCDDGYNNVRNQFTNSQLSTNCTTQQQSRKKKILNVIIVTFDKGGVSGHPNHIHTCHGVRHLLSRLHGHVSSSSSLDNKDDHGGGSDSGGHDDDDVVEDANVVSISASSFLSPSFLTTQLDRQGMITQHLQQPQQGEREEREEEEEEEELIIQLHGWELHTISNPIWKYFPLLDWLLLLLLNLVIWNVSLLFAACTRRRRRKVVSAGGGSNSNNSILDHSGLSSLISSLPKHVIEQDYEMSERGGRRRRTTNMKPAKTWVTYRMFQPRLVWKAMAAHQTQFVWYRRLSVLFSRYSYVNTLKKMDVVDTHEPVRKGEIKKKKS